MMSGNDTVNLSRPSELSIFIKDSVKFHKCCTSIGFLVGPEYKPDAEVLARLKDLMRYLRSENNKTCYERQHMLKYLLGQHLVPLLMHQYSSIDLSSKISPGSKEADLRFVGDITVRLLLNLTDPATVCFNSGHLMLTETLTHAIALTRLLSGCKQNFIKKEFWDCIARRLRSLVNIVCRISSFYLPGEVRSVSLCSFYSRDAFVCTVAQPPDDRTEDDELDAQRLLNLVANALALPEPDGSSTAPPGSAQSSLTLIALTSQRASATSQSVHDLLVGAILESEIGELICQVAASESSFSFYAIEIIHHLFFRQKPEDIALACNSLADFEKVNDDNELAKIVEREKLAKKLAQLRSRNRDFIGTFVLDEIATPERPLAQQVTYRTACGLGLEEETLDEHKRLRRQPKNRRTLGLEERERRSVPRVRHLLHAFAIKVLSSAYTPLTKTAKAVLAGGTAGSEQSAEDEQHLVWLIYFFVAFARHYLSARAAHSARDESLGSISAEPLLDTLTFKTFHQLHTLMTAYLDNLTIDKLNARKWCSRVEPVLAAYKELLCFVDWLESGHAGGEPLLLVDAAFEFRERVREVKEQLFYQPEYRELLAHLFAKFNQTRFSRNYLHDLIEATYVFHHLLTRSLAQSDGALLVQNKRRSKSLIHRLQKAMRVAQSNSQLAQSKKPKLDQLLEAQAPSMAEEVLLERWTEIEAKANKEPEQFFSVGESLERGHQAFDAAVLEVSFEEQALVCTMRVQDALRARSDVRLALELLRPARLLWPNKFGARPEPPAPALSDEAAAAPAPEDPAAPGLGRAAQDLRADLDALREIFMVDLSAPRADLLQRLGTPVKKLLVLPSEDGSELVLDEVDASDPEHADDENEEMEEILDADMMLIEEEEQLEAASESVFDLQIFVDKLAAPATMHALFLALGEFDRNPERVTHCTMRLLHALTFARARPDPSAPIDAEPFDSDKAAADAAIGHLFQLRLLVIFRKLLSNKLYASLSEYKELREFALHTIRALVRSVKRDPKTLIYTLFPNVVKNVTPGSEAAPKKQRATKRSKGRGRRGGQSGPFQMEDLLGESVPARDEPGHDADADDDLLLGPLAEKRQRLWSDEEQQQFQPYIPPRARAPSPPSDLPTVTAVDEDGFAPGELDAMLLDAARSLETELLN